LRIADTKFPTAPCAKELISVCVVFFIYFYEKI
jgi:hypothetical protein